MGSNSNAAHGFDVQGFMKALKIVRNINLDNIDELSPLVKQRKAQQEQQAYGNPRAPYEANAYPQAPSRAFSSYTSASQKQVFVKQHGFSEYAASNRLSRVSEFELPSEASCLKPESDDEDIFSSSASSSSKSSASTSSSPKPQEPSQKTKTEAKEIAKPVKAEAKKEESKKTSPKKLSFEDLKVGDKVKGVVDGLTSYGAFVDLGEVSGLIHISQMSHEYIDDPKEILSEGDEVEVMVVKLEAATKRVSLSLKALQEKTNDADDEAEELKVGDICEGTVKNIVSFGCFVKLPNGQQGLVHKSELDSKNKDIDPKEVVSKGDKVKVKVIKIDHKNKRINLSIKRCK